MVSHTEKQRVNATISPPGCFIAILNPSTRCSPWLKSIFDKPFSRGLSIHYRSLAFQLFVYIIDKSLVLAVQRSRFPVTEPKLVSKIHIIRQLSRISCFNRWVKVCQPKKWRINGYQHFYTFEPLNPQPETDPFR